MIAGLYGNRFVFIGLLVRKRREGKSGGSTWRAGKNFPHC